MFALETHGSGATVPPANYHDDSRRIMNWHDWQAMGGAIVTKETRDTSLEAWQEKVGTFRLRTEPGLTVGDCTAAIARLCDRAPIDAGAVLVEVMTIARLQRHDLAHALKQAFAQLERDYEAGQR